MLTTNQKKILKSAGYSIAEGKLWCNKNKNLPSLGLLTSGKVLEFDPKEEVKGAILHESFACFIKQFHIKYNIEIPTFYELLDFDFSPTFSRENGKDIITAWAQLGTEDGDALEVEIDLIDFCAYLQTKGLIDDFYTVNKNGQKEMIIEFGGGSVVEWSPSKQDAIERFHNTCTIYVHNLVDIVTLQQLEAYFNHPETTLKFK